MRNRNGRWLALAIITLLSAACGKNSMPGRVAADPNAIPVVVDNSSRYTMDIYVRDGSRQPTLLGTVQPSQVKTLVLEYDPISPGPYTLTAESITGSGGARSGALMVKPGDSIRFRIRQNLAASVATVH